MKNDRRIARIKLKNSWETNVIRTALFEIQRMRGETPTVTPP